MKLFLFSRLSKSAWLPRLLALLGALTLGVQLWAYARAQTTFVDEGTYLYLGFSFVSGDLSYGQLGGWNYYAPLSYFIPGLTQFFFGPSLATGRYFSILCALLAALAAWVLARRLRGDWWAAATLWALALMPMQIKMYSLGLSQALTACLLSWTLVLLIGEKRSTAWILAGAFLAGLTVITRHNLVFLLPALVGYVLWQHGRRQALLALAVSLLPVLLGMALFWPSSLRLWTPFWLPEQWFPFLSRFGPPPATQPLWTADRSLGGRMSAFFMGMRAHFFTLVGAFAALLLWPLHWESPFHKRVAVFLGFTFFSSLLLHGWVTLGGNYCIFCFAPYTAFFSTTGLLFVVNTLPNCRHKPTATRTALILLFLFLVALAPAYLDNIGDQLLSLPLPRLSGGLHFGEWTTLWSYLNHWFSLEYPVMRQILPPIYFLSVAFLLLVTLAGLYSLLKRRLKSLSIGFAPFALLIVLASGFILSPTLLNAPYRQDQECGQDMFAYYEQFGTDLAALISPGSRVYWQVRSAIPLLYLPPVEIYPAQVYSIHTYRLGGDPRQVEALGYWNDEISRQWAEEADILVLEGEQSYTPVNAEFAKAHGYQRIAILPALNPCEYSPQQIFIFRKSP